MFPQSGCGDNFLLLLPRCQVEYVAILLGSMSSLLADFVVRQKLGGTSFKYYVFKQVPFPDPPASARLKFPSSCSA